MIFTDLFGCSYSVISRNNEMGIQYNAGCEARAYQNAVPIITEAAYSLITMRLYDCISAVMSHFLLNAANNRQMTPMLER